MNYYDLLGISPNASLAQIREAYRRLAKQYHPDRFHRLSETAKTYVQEKMLLINEAYRVLSDPDERQKYNQGINNQSPSSQAYARYVELDWKLVQLLGQDKSRKRELERIHRAQTIPLSWMRGIGFPLFLFEDFARQGGVVFDLLMIFFLLIVGIGAKSTIWRSKASLGFWISWGCLWEWIFFISPNFSFYSNSDLWHGIPFLLFLLSQALFARLGYLIEEENNAIRLHEQIVLQQEVSRILAELKKLENEIFGTENRPFSQSRYNYL